MESELYVRKTDVPPDEIMKRVRQRAGKEPPRLSEVFGRYLSKLQAEGKPYYSESRLFLDRMLDQWGDLPSGDLKAEHTKSFHVYLREVGYSPAYCDRHIAVGKAAFNYALPDAPNPFKRVDMYHPDNTLVRFLSADEEHRLLEAARTRRGFGPPLYDILVVAIHTGLRKTNILRLHVSEINLTTETITLRQKRDRSLTVPMNRAVVDVLKPRVLNAPPSGWIFLNKKTGLPWIQCEKSFQTAKRVAGITRPFRFHDLRHHFARNLLIATNNLRLVQTFLGHTNPATTTKYAHMIMDDLKQAAAMLVPSTSDVRGYIRGYIFSTRRD
jgi:integrase